MTSMPSSKSSSAICGVMPKPPAAFSPLATVSSTPCCFCNSGRRSCTMVRPGRAKISPTNSMRNGTPEIGETRAESRYYHVVRRDLPGDVPESVGELRSLQEIVVAGGSNRYATHAVGVNEDIIEVPEIDVRQLLRNDPLDLVVDGFAFVLVQRCAAFSDQLVHARVREKRAIGALRRE